MLLIMVSASVIGAGDDTFTLVLKARDGKENAIELQLLKALLDLAYQV